MLRATTFRFCLVGALVAALDFGALWILKRVLSSMLAVSLAYFVAIAAHFCLNKWWVFGSRREIHATEFARYAFMVLACWLCTIGVVWLALRLLTPNVLFAKALAVPPASVLAFVMMRWFVFRRG